MVPKPVVRFDTVPIRTVTVVPPQLQLQLQLQLQIQLQLQVQYYHSTCNSAKVLLSSIWYYCMTIQANPQQSIPQQYTVLQ